MVLVWSHFFSCRCRGLKGEYSAQQSLPWSHRRRTAISKTKWNSMTNVAPPYATRYDHIWAASFPCIPPFFAVFQQAIMSGANRVHIIYKHNIYNRRNIRRGLNFSWWAEQDKLNHSKESTWSSINSRRENVPTYFFYLWRSISFVDILYVLYIFIYLQTLRINRTDTDLSIFSNLSPPEKQRPDVLRVDVIFCLFPRTLRSFPDNVSTFF